MFSSHSVTTTLAVHALAWIGVFVWIIFHTFSLFAGFCGRRWLWRRRRGCFWNKRFRHGVFRAGYMFASIRRHTSNDA